ncbi:MAG: hypothetical protein LBG19_06130 [Prevotellaceae bacterium]|jgi:adenine-specific DNA-methyltransferase|nr:hypothetical protein [Prevotellaceae bacterium]
MPNTYSLKELDPNVKWRKYYQKQNSLTFNNVIPFSNVAKVSRGIATGANEYFVFSKSKADKYKIDKKYLLSCICKSTDVESNFFTINDYEKLIEKDRPAFLFNGCGVEKDEVKRYIKYGEEQGVNKKYLTSCRNPWYSLENRIPAPIWVSVFNRNGLKFVRNEASISNLTTFHCVYPIQSNLLQMSDIDLLFAYLLTDTAKQIFEDNRREYGNGLRKFEPNDLNGAMMLDLTILPDKIKDEILGYHRIYRKTVLSSNTDKSLLDKIDSILKKYYQR